MIKRRINNLIRKLAAYRSCVYYITIRSRTPEECQTIKALIQHGVLSLTVFNILVDKTITECEAKLKKLNVMYIRL